MKSNNKENNSSLVPANKTALTRVANQIDTTNRILIKINIVENRNWWNGLDQKWKEIFLMNLRLSESKAKFGKRIPSLRGWYEDIYKEEFILDNLPSVEEINKILNLEKLDTSDCDLKDIKPITRLEKLKHLDIEENKISDLSPLSDLKELESIDCDYNPIFDFSPISKLPKLKIFSSRDSALNLESILPLSNSLEQLWVENRIFNFNFIDNFLSLDSLWCSRSGLKDLNSLKNNIRLKELFCENNLISSLEPLSNLTNLRQLWIDNNLVDDLAPIEGLAKLEEICCHSNLLKSIKPLFGLKNIKTLHCESNFIPSEEIDEFKHLHPKCKVDAWFQHSIKEFQNKQKNILVINDDETFCWLIKEQLEDLGLNVDTVYAGEYGLSAYKMNKYDLVFLDFYMHPNFKKGDEIISEMQKIDDSIPIIMLTIELSREIEVECIRLGAREWIYQPYDWVDIDRVLKKYLKFL